MSQHDYNIANGGGAAVRADMNNALLAILSQNSGATAPTTTKPYMFWYDTTAGVLKMRNAADTAWVDAITGISGGNGLGMVNRFINGRMEIDQRNSGSSVTPVSGDYTLDRFRVYMTQASKFSVQQNAGAVTPPVGFSNYMGITSLSAYSSLAADYFTFRQRIEGFNFADMAWGTANASPVTLSFWVRSSLTGTFAGVVSNSAGNRSYPFTYTISSANTWEQKVVNIAGDTTGTWIGATNGTGAQVIFSLGAGSTYLGTANAWAGAELYGATGQVNVVGTSGATLYVTGIDLREGKFASAPAWDWRPYGTELALCQRYGLQLGSGEQAYQTMICSGQGQGATTGYLYVEHPVTMRTGPALTYSALSDLFYDDGSGGYSPSALSVITNQTSSIATTLAATVTATAASRMARLRANAATSARLFLSAEL